MMSITNTVRDTYTFNELQEVAKIPESKVRRLIREKKVKGQLKPLSVETKFFEGLKFQTDEQKTLDDILYFGEAAELISNANVTTLKINKHALKYAVTNGLFIDQRLVDQYRYWVDEKIKVDEYRIKIKNDAIFHYRWGGENIGSPLLKRQAVEELVGIFEKYQNIQILCGIPQKRNPPKCLISSNLFIEKHGPKNRKGTNNIGGHPLVFIYGEIGNMVAYIEESKGEPRSHYSNDCDSERIRFASNELAYRFLEIGLKDWSRIARYKYKGRNYGVFFFLINDYKCFNLYFPIHDSLKIDRYLAEAHYKLLENIASELFGQRCQHLAIMDKDPPLWFSKTIKLYERYRKLVYK